eukprot:TRINITY_DN11912_c0_g1_i1.p1 TRINITY_DN11912_c0_g1~~TRINITY_DN11912_c0_g1_i1.p1  ORF type:complete len:513 (+),score=111.39 TRINITY_DN11912_c0_g1_i1:92-1630(+)
MSKWQTAAKLLPQGRKPDRNEQRATYFGKVFLEETYEKLVKHLRWSQKDISQFIEPLMDTCLVKSEEVLAADLAADARQVKKQLHSALLSAMQEIRSLKSEQNDDHEQLVFFEPLKHLDDATKRLVLELVVDRVTKVINGTLSLDGVRKSMAKAASEAEREASPRIRGTIVALSNEVDNTVATSKVSEALRGRKEAIDRAHHAEELAEDATKLLKDKTREISALRQELEDLKDIRSKLASAEDRFLDADTRRRELEASLQEVQANVVELAKQRNDAEEVQAHVAELAKQRDDAEEADMRCQAPGQLAVRRQDAETQCEALEALSNAIGEDQIESSQTQVVQSAGQTSLDGGAPKPSVADLPDEPKHVYPGIEDLTLENEQLKMMLRESQAKLMDLIEHCKTSQMQDGSLSEMVTSLMADVGLDPFSKDDRVFQRLHRDAVNRVSRLQDLQDKHREKHVHSDSHKYPVRNALSDHRFIIPPKGSIVNKGFIMRRGRHGYSLGRQHHKFELEQL